MGKIVKKTDLNILLGLLILIFTVGATLQDQAPPDWFTVIGAGAGAILIGLGVRRREE
jgi:hypothetical protein